MQSNENEIILSHLKKDQSAVIVLMLLKPKVKKRLADLGLTIGTKIEVLRKIRNHGPIEIKARESKLILGRGIHSKILVSQI